MVRQITFIALGIALFARAAAAALPFALDGQQLPSLAPMLKNIQPAVVNISASAQGDSREHLLENFYRRYFDLTPRAERRFASRGSGVIINQDGLILTNQHVIEDADTIQVTLPDGRKFAAELVGADTASDVALLRIDADDLTAIQLGKSSELQVGDFVVAIGNPFGLGQSVSSGIVSALGRSGLGIEGYEDFIQTDAAINPGNSGGALVNLRGELVGINTAIVSPSGGSIGLSFAIPIDMAAALTAQLLEFGGVRRGLLGVSMQELTPALAEAFGVKGKHGVIVASVLPASAAAEAGLLEGDVVTQFNDTEIHDPADLRNAVGLLRPGESAMVAFYRAGERRQVRAKIKSVEDTEFARGDEDAGAGLLVGVQLERARGGVRVTQIRAQSRAARAGLAVGDLIVAANNVPVDSPQGLRAIERRADRLFLRLMRRGRWEFLLIR